MIETLSLICSALMTPNWVIVKLHLPRLSRDWISPSCGGVPTKHQRSRWPTKIDLLANLENFYGIIHFHLTKAEQAWELPDIGQRGTNTVFWRHKADLCEFLEHAVEQSVLLLSQACGLASQPTWIIAIAPNAAHVYTIPSEPTGHRHRHHRHCRHPIDPKLFGQDESLLGAVCSWEQSERVLCPFHRQSSPNEGS
jgi:hypothetical protein